MKVLLLVALTCLLGNFASAQPPCDCANKKKMTVFVDFQNRKIGLPCRHIYHRGDTVYVVVYNYNPYLYQVAVNGTDTATETPTEGTLFSTFLNPSNISTIVAGLASQSGIGGTAFSPSLETSAKVDYAYDLEYKAAPQPIRDSLDKALYLVPKPPPGNSNKKLTKEQKLEMLGKMSDRVFDKYLPKVRQDQQDIQDLVDSLQELLYNMSKKTDFLYDAVPDDQKFNSGTLIDSIRSNYKAFKKKVDSLLKRANEELFAFSDESSPLKALYSNKDEIDNNNQVRVRDSLVINFYTQGIKLLNQMDSTVSITEVLRRKNAILQINPLRSTYTSLPLYFLNGPKDIAVSVTPWSDSSRLPSYNTTLELPMKRYFIIGVSAGFYTSWLGDENFATDSTITGNAPGDTSYQLIRDGKSRLEFGIAAHVFVAWRLCGQLYAGPSFGAGMSFESNAKPRVFLGGTIIFGDNNRIALTGGITGGYTQRLSAPFKQGVMYGSPPADFTSNQISSNAFISLTYSFLNN
jgi:hypothetical protein